jgi:dTDP-4-amino-4,6-dideoxygalactose transaminase
LVDLARLHKPIADQLQATLASLLDSSAFTLGEELEQFENAFATYIGVRHCVGVASGTAALALTLEAYGIGPGDEVIVPAHTFIASAFAVTEVGATPVLCDVKRDTGLIDVEAVRAAIGARTVAIMPVHLYGQVCEMASLQAVAERHGLLVIEDVAQAHGSLYHGARAGSMGAAGAFSFYPTKNLGCLGDGGAVCTDDDLLAARLRRLRNLGQRSKGDHVECGHNQRLDALQAAWLRVKLPYLDGWNAARREHAGRYRQLLPEGVRVLEERGASPCTYHLFPVRVSARERVATALRDHGIQTAVHYFPAVHQHGAWRDRRLQRGALPEAEQWAAEELSLPMHPDLRSEEIERVAEALHEAVLIDYG